MPSVQIKENENFEYALRRFKRACDQADIINEARKRDYYEKPTWAKKRLKAQAVKRLHKQLSLSRRVL